MAKKKIQQVSIEEYKKLKDKQAKKRLKINYPWPVKIALLVPLSFFVILILAYLLYIRRFAAH